MSLRWAALARHPHSLAAGENKLHAKRLALLARRNSCETLFSALQAGSKLGGDGVARTRTAKEPTVEALVGLSLMMRSAFMLASLRVRDGDFPARPPDDLARALGLPA
jgi:hypothetical protein